MFSRLNSMIELVKFSPLGGGVYIASYLVVILVSLILHECAHGYMALRCGDPTAKMLGRLSLNPLHHLDPVGTLCMFLFGFGWAKPVPVNPRNFNDYRRDDLVVSIAGITLNLTLFLLSVALMVGLRGLTGEYAVNLVEANYLIAPQSLPRNANLPLAFLYQFVDMMAHVNLALAVFNLLPIPPLDGYHILNDLVLKGRFQLSSSQFHYAQIILILICTTGTLSGLLSTINNTVFSAVFNMLKMLVP